MLTGQDPVAAYGALVSGALGSDGRIGETLINTIPLILTGLAVAVGFRGGLFNIGAEGQLLLGALVAAAVAPVWGVPPLLGIPLLMLFGAAAGAAFAFIPGILKARLGANEVITTLMLSYVAFYISEYLIVNPLKEPGVLPATALIAEADRLPRVSDAMAAVGLVEPGGQLLGRLHLGLLVALLVAAAIAYLFSRTVPGFSIRLLGLNPEAARYGGVPIGRTIVMTMMLSGAIAGLAGVIQVLGVNYRMSSSFSPGFGFTGIAIALLGNVSAGGVVLAAGLFGMLQTGGQVMQRTAGTPSSIVTIIEGLVIFFVAVQLYLPTARLYRWSLRLRRRRS